MSMKLLLGSAAAAILAGCAGTPSEETGLPPQGPQVTSEMLKPLTDAYREYVADLVTLNSLVLEERTKALSRLEAGPYSYFQDDRELINRAAKGDATARKELGRRGIILDSLFAFWGEVDLVKWNDARKRIVALGQDARVVLVNTLLRMLLNGQMRVKWTQIRFQLIEVGDDTFETAVALFKAKAEQTPPNTIMFKRDDLVQIALVIMGFGERGRPVIEEQAKSPNFNVRRAIATALGEGRAAEHFTLLETLLRKDPEWMVRSDAADSMGSMRVRAKAGAALLAALKAEKDRNVMRHIVESIGLLVYDEAVPTLISSLEVADYDFVERAMGALYKITGEKLTTSDQWRKWYVRDYEKWKQKKN
jgi:hypothetical protein